MSQSPHESDDPAAALRYGRAWLALNTLLRQGMSFSGRERNRCFLNLGTGTFANVSFVLGLDHRDDGRAAVAVDWDWDGDLDLWTTNGTAPRIRYLSNDGPTDHHFLALRLQGATANRDAVGARVELYLRDAEHPRRIKTVRAGDGYLSQSTKWVHFGLGPVEDIERVVVRWPGGDAETFRGLQADRYWSIVQGSGHAVPYQSPRLPALAARPDGQTDGSQSSGRTSGAVPSESETQSARVLLIDPLELPPLQYHTLDASRPLTSLPPGPLLVGLWATWCPPCIEELQQWASQRDELSAAGVNVLALCVDRPPAEGSDVADVDPADLLRVVSELGLPFDVGIPEGRLVRILDIAQRTFIPARRPLVLPSSFLLDTRGRLAAIYKGPVSSERVIADSRLESAGRDERLAAAIPFGGRWLERPASLSPRKLALALYEAGESEAAMEYVDRLIASQSVDHAPHPLANEPEELAQLYRIKAAMLTDAKLPDQAIVALQNLLRYAPHDAEAHLELGNWALRQSDLTAAERHLQAAMSAKPQDASVQKALATLRVRQGRSAEAMEHLRRALDLREDAETHFALANGLFAAGQPNESVRHLESALRLRPGWPAAANNLAWILATHSDPSVHDAPRAVELAEHACRATDHAVPEFLLTYGAALAAAGRFDEAIDAAESAATIARQRNQPGLLARAQEQLALYRNRRPLHTDGMGR